MSEAISAPMSSCWVMPLNLWSDYIGSAQPNGKPNKTDEECRAYLSGKDLEIFNRYCDNPKRDKYQEVFRVNVLCGNHTKHNYVGRKTFEQEVTCGQCVAQYVKDFKDDRFYLNVNEETKSLSPDPDKRRSQKARSSQMAGFVPLAGMGLAGFWLLPPVQGRRGQFLCPACHKTWRSVDADRLGKLVRTFAEGLERLPLARWVVNDDMTFMNQPVFGNKIWTPCVTLPILLHE